MGRRVSTKSLWIILLVLLLIFQSVAIWALVDKSNRLSSEVSKTPEILAQINNTLNDSSFLRNKNDAGFGYEKVVVDPISSVVYMPEFKIKLPYNAITKTIAYTMRVDENGKELKEADATSTNFIAPQQVTVMDCSILVRLKVEPGPSPYSPHEKTTSVKLGDGRVLQVYELINQDECNDSWNNSISPSAFAKEFKKAQTY